MYIYICIYISYCLCIEPLSLYGCLLTDICDTYDEGGAFILLSIVMKVCVIKISLFSFLTIIFFCF